MTLGDLGADVIKVERPESGDESRTWGPPFDEQGQSAYFLSANRNKLSIALDLDLDADLAVLASLIRDAHVVIDNFRPGTLERRGLDPARLLGDVPGLIWCTVTGYGQGSLRPGYDFAVQAESGWMSITGEAEGAPMKVGVALADLLAGKDAVIAILASLAAGAQGVARPPDARWLFISLVHSATAALVNVAQNYLVSGVEPVRWGNAHPNLVPYQLFAALDRPLVVAVGSDAQWRNCCAALALDHLAADESLASNAGRLLHRDRVVGALSGRLRERPAAAWMERLGAAGVPCGLVRTVPEALRGVGASAMAGIDPAVPGTVRLPPPRLDEHGPIIRRAGWGAFAQLAAPAD